MWRGAFWLTVGSFVSKVMGTVYRIFLPRLLGDTGVGLFQMAYPLYALLLALSVNGVPIALSKVTAELRSRGDTESAEAVAAWAFWGLAAAGAVMALAMGTQAGWLARHLFQEPRAQGAIAALSPALVLVAMQAALRGYFQGRQDMAPTAWSQILEQAVRVAVMFPLAVWFLPRGVAAAAAAATLGAPAGAAAGLGYLLCLRRRVRDGPRARRRPPWAALRRLVAIAAPMAMAALLFPLMLLVDSVVVPGRLISVGLSPNAATAAYGRLAGEAMPLLNVALIVGTALAVSLVPTIAEAMAAGRRDAAQDRVGMAMRAVWLVTLPMAGGLLALARPLCRYLYGDAGAAPALEVLALGTAFLALQQVLGNALQAAGRGWAPVVSLVMGAGIKFGLAWWLVPVWGIRGAAASTVVAALCTTLLNWRAWCRSVGTPARSPWATALVPGAAAAAMAVVVRMYILTVRVTPVTTGAAVALGVLLYVALTALGGERRFLRAFLTLR